MGEAFFLRIISLQKNDPSWRPKHCTAHSEMFSEWLLTIKEHIFKEIKRTLGVSYFRKEVKYWQRYYFILNLGTHVFFLISK